MLFPCQPWTWVCSVTGVAEAFHLLVGSCWPDCSLLLCLASLCPGAGGPRWSEGRDCPWWVLSPRSLLLAASPPWGRARGSWPTCFNRNIFFWSILIIDLKLSPDLFSSIWGVTPIYRTVLVKTSSYSQAPGLAPTTVTGCTPCWWKRRGSLTTWSTLVVVMPRLKVDGRDKNCFIIAVSWFSHCHQCFLQPQVLVTATIAPGYIWYMDACVDPPPCGWSIVVSGVCHEGYCSSSLPYRVEGWMADCFDRKVKPLRSLLCCRPSLRPCLAVDGRRSTGL